MKKLMSLLLAVVMVVSLIGTPFAAQGATRRIYESGNDANGNGRYDIINTNDITGWDIVNEAKKWLNKGATYWSGVTPWPDCVTKRMGFTQSNGGIYFDCSGFVSRVLNDVGLRCNELSCNYGSSLLAERYGSHYLSSDISYMRQYGTNIDAQVQRAKNGDWSGMQPGDLITFVSSNNHILIYAGQNSSNQPMTIEVYGNGSNDCVRYGVLFSNYPQYFEHGARLVGSAGPALHVVRTVNCLRNIQLPERVVDLYSNVTDTTRTTYYSYGPKVRSEQYAVMSDGTTRFKVGVNHGGQDMDMWLIYASDMSSTVFHTFGDTLYESAHPHKGYWQCECGEIEYTGTTRKVSGCSQCYPTQYTVTFNANGGSCSTSSRTVNAGNTIGSLPAATRTGYTFDGWFTSKTGGTQVSSSTVVNNNMTVYAHWTAKLYTLTLDFGYSSSDPQTQPVTYGQPYNIIWSVSGHYAPYFTGWYTEKTGGTKVTSDTIVTTANNHTLYAHFSLIAYEVENGNIYFDPSAGSIVGADGTITKAVIPQTIDNVTVKSIGKTAFGWCESLESVTLPNTVEKIEFEAFICCKALSYITMPEGIKKIASDAFHDCYKLNAITIPSTVESIGEYAFSRCSELEFINVRSGNKYYSSIDGVLFNQEKTLLIACPNGKSGEYIVPNSVTHIENNAFLHCGNLTSVIIPASVKTIGEYAFHDCTNLTNVVLSEGLSEIEYNAFNYCPSLTSIIIPESVISIGKDAFYSCNSLTSVKLPSGLICIEGGLFYYCTSLERITIPDSVKSIGAYAFNETGLYKEESNWENGLLYIDRNLIAARRDITSCVIKDGIKVIADGAFYYCNAMTAVTIPNTVEYLGEGAFQACKSLSSIIIPESVTELKENACSYCTNLREITIPKSISSIAKAALRNCENLSDVYYMGTEEQWNNILIDNTDSYNDPILNAKIHFIKELSIIAQPQNVSCEVGSAARMHVVADGEGLNYQWYTSTAGSSTWEKSDSSGADTDTLTIQAQANLNGQLYRCEITDADGNVVVSDAAVLKVSVPEPNNPFTDVAKGKFYYDPVLWALYHDPVVTTGVTKTTFEPDRICTRAHVVTFLWRANGCPEPKLAANPFKDVPTSKYYYKAVLWAAEQGITTGYSDGTFRPDDECTRGQVVTFLWRAEGSPKSAGVSNPFSDVPSGKYYTTAVLWALQTGITQGRTSTTFGPDDSCTRGHVVTFLYRACN